MSFCIQSQVTFKRCSLAPHSTLQSLSTQLKQLPYSNMKLNVYQDKSYHLNSSKPGQNPWSRIAAVTVVLFTAFGVAAWKWVKSSYLLLGFIQDYLAGHLIATAKGLGLGDRCLCKKFRISTCTRVGEVALFVRTFDPMVQLLGFFD